MSVVWFTCNECQFNLDCFGFTQYIRFINEFIFTWYNTNFWRYHISASLNKIVLYPWSGYNVILWQITVHSVMDTTGIADAKIPIWHISICSLNTLTFSHLPIAKKYSCKTFLSIKCSINHAINLASADLLFEKRFIFDSWCM